MYPSVGTYYGGKGMIAKHIHKVLARVSPTHYVETHCGMCSVLLNAPTPYPSEVINDKWGVVSNFWSVLSDPSRFDKFARFVNCSPVSEVGFDHARYVLDNPNDYTSEYRAAAFFILSRQSFAGKMESFRPPVKSRLRGGQNESVNSWLNAVDMLPEFHARMRRVQVYNRYAIDIIRLWDSKDTLFYCDPPYLHSTRKSTHDYVCEMTDLDHHFLLSNLATIKGKFALSGYRSPLYDDAAARCGWNRMDIETANHAAKGDDKRVMTECLWTNF